MIVSGRPRSGSSFRSRLGNGLFNAETQRRGDRPERRCCN